MLIGVDLEMEPDVPEFAASRPAWLRLEQQLKWYDSKSVECQKYYKRLKLLQVGLAVLIPITAQLPTNFSIWLTALSGTAIAFLEGWQQLGQYSTLWVTYRSTAERLKHEKYLFLSEAGPYKSMNDSDRLVNLAERVEEHVSTEHANWFNDTQRIVVEKKKSTN